jgi:hypothetical protein
MWEESIITSAAQTTRVRLEAFLNCLRVDICFFLMWDLNDGFFDQPFVEKCLSIPVANVEQRLTVWATFVSHVCLHILLCKLTSTRFKFQ